MPDYAAIEQRLMSHLRLERRPVAIAFLGQAPAGVRKFEGSEPSGCSFWRIASERGAFYTEPSHHYNCAIGCYTHQIPLPEARAAELDQTLEFMMELGYIRAEDLPGIARMAATPPVIIYAPLGETPVAPNVAVFWGKPGRIMLLQESALRAGIGQAPYFGRPTCMALPAAMDKGVVVSSACIGNRVYTGLPEDELYIAVRGRDLERIAGEIGTIADANAKLADYHRQRLVQLRTS